MTKRKTSTAILREIDHVIYRVFDELRLDGISLTDHQKDYGVSVVKQSPGFKAIEEAVRRGAETELEHVVDIVREQFFAAIRKPLLNAVKQLPHPKGGRRRSLTDEQKVEVRRDIGALMGHGAQLKDAVKRVSQSVGVSTRTIHRVWQERTESDGMKKS